MSENKVNAKLIENGEKCYLQVDLPENPRIDLTSDDNMAIKRFFSQILFNLLNDSFSLKLTTNENEIENKLAYDVSIEYISQLNKEIEALVISEQFQTVKKLRDNCK